MDVGWISAMMKGPDLEPMDDEAVILLPTLPERITEYMSAHPEAIIDDLQDNHRCFPEVFQSCRCTIFDIIPQDCSLSDLNTFLSAAEQLTPDLFEDGVSALLTLKQSRMGGKIRTEDMQRQVEIWSEALQDALSTDDPYWEPDSCAAERRIWADEAAANRARLGSDLASGVRQLYALEQELHGQGGTIGEWLRAAYEINEDFEQPLAEVVGEICDALREADRRCGRSIAQQLYDTQTIILPTEIKNAAHYLSIGGRFESFSDLAHVGFLMDDPGHDVMARAADFMNAGGSAEEVFEHTRDPRTAGPQEDGGSPTLFQG